MAQSSQDSSDHPVPVVDMDERRQMWSSFLNVSKWFALGIMGLIFFLIFTLIVGVPFLPALVGILLFIFLAGALFH